MTYEVTGDMLAPTLFEIDQRNGDISVKSSLKEDDAFEYTVSISLCSEMVKGVFFCIIWRGFLNGHMTIVRF